MADIHLETKNLSFTYHDGTEALKNVNIQWDRTVPENQLYFLISTV